MREKCRTGLRNVREKSQRLAREPKKKRPQRITRRKSKRKKGSKNKTKVKDQDFIQAITIKLPNDLVITGTYVGPQTKQKNTSEFLTDSLHRFGTNQVIVGDLNARHTKWDTTSNDRGNAVMEVVHNTPGAHVIAAKELPYFKTIKSAKGGLVSPRVTPTLPL